MRTHDVIIIGSGAAGQTVATECAKAGRSVAVVDRLPFGGTCALRGCMPKKVLLSAAEATARMAALDGIGVTGEARVDWPALMRRKRGFTDPVPGNTMSWMTDMGIDTITGTARFISPDSLEVDGEVFGAPAIVLATGARPIDLGIGGQDLVMSSTDFLDLDEMPERVAFIGGGYISFEFSWLAHRAGADVTIIHRSAQVLKGFEPGLAEQLAGRYRSLGIDIMLDAPVQGVEKSAGGLAVVTPDRIVEVDAVFHGAGRAPDLEGLDLETGGVEYSRRGVTVDRSLRSTTNPIVWAVGDAAGIGTPLTPVAGAQGEVAASGILGTPATYEDRFTPSVVFSDPPLARVGIGEDAAADDARLEVRTFDMSTWFTQKRVGNDTAGAVLVVDRESGAIRGAHLLGVEADEIINVFTLAVQFGITIDDLKTVTWSYPTLAYEINYLTGRY
ncbi:MAG: NAD(P)/FAD-dependent oxidoreductase [Anaerosomatales bacterium]|nr:NAD(P)/FAD-dependent oxidoreductase [Anaerosomatales bacterium]